MTRAGDRWVRPRRRPPARRAAVLAAALAAGAGAVLTAGPLAAQDAEPVVVTITDAGFEPESLEVPAGTEVRWENTGEVVHGVTADDGSFDSGLIPPGDSFTHRFAEPGTFEYSSPVDAPPRFPGTVTVTAAPAPTPAPTDTAPGDTAEEPGARQPATPSRPSDLAETGPDEPYGWLLVGLGLVLVGIAARTWFRAPVPLADPAGRGRAGDRRR